MSEFHTFETARAIRIHQDELLQDAAKYRLIRQSRANYPGWRQRIQVSAGSLLIAIGKKLQEPYQIATTGKAQAC